MNILNVPLTQAQALALLASSLEHGNSRHDKRPDLAEAEIAIARCLYYSSKSSQDAPGEPQAVNEYIADEGM